MDIWYYVMTPFTWLLMFFYNIFNSYGVALIFFALVVKLILFPLSLKGKRSMIQVNMISGKVQKLQKQYANNQQKLNEETQKLYEKEGVNPMGGCLWSMIPLFILLPLYAIIRQPLKYMMGLSPDQIASVAQAVNWSSAAVSNGWIREAAEFANVGYNQLYLSSLITPETLSAVKAAAGTTAREIFSINFDFLGVNLALVPQLKFWVNGLMGFALFVVPVLSAGTSMIFTLVSTKTNQIAQAQQQSEQAQRTNRTMMLISPLMSLWIGFSMPAALSVYWIMNNLLGMGQEVICSKLLKKDYEKAAAEAKRRAEEEKEEEKRLRREKAEQRAREAEEARKNRGKKKPKEPEEDKIPAAVKEASRVGIRQYARGRAYDPDRFGGVTPYHEDAEKAPAVPETADTAPDTAPVGADVLIGPDVPDTTPETKETAPIGPDAAAPIDADAPDAAAAPEEDTAPAEDEDQA